MKTPTNEKLAEWAEKISTLARNLAPFISKFTTDPRDLEAIFLYTKLIRHSMIMKDVSVLMRQNSTQELTSTFILVRCMLEDFISLLYLKMNSFDKNLLIDFMAENVGNKFMVMEYIAKINKRFFKDKGPGMFTFDFVAKAKNDFAADSNNVEVFDDRKRFKLREFPSPKKIIAEIEINDLSIANVGSLLDWTHFSTYVHHSIISSREDTDPKLNRFKLLQLKISMLYAYKLVEFCGTRMTERNIPFDFIQDDILIDELTEGNTSIDEFL